MKSKRILLTELQRIDLEQIWFIYGNGGKKSTLGNHKFIQQILESRMDRREFYSNQYNFVIGEQKLTTECIDAVDKIINNYGKEN